MKKITYNYILLFFSAILFGFPSFAQTVSGVIFDAQSMNYLPQVLVVNKKTNAQTFSAENGFYQILADKNDTLQFLLNGYSPLLLTVSIANKQKLETVFLKELHQTLKEIVIQSDHRIKDSIDQRIIYKKYINDANFRPSINSINSSGMGFGLSFNGLVSYAVSVVSGRQSRLEKFKRNLENEEKSKYINTKYNVLLVQDVLKLDAEAAQQFILKNPMPIEFAAQATALEMKIWIREAYKKMNQPKSSPSRNSR